MVKRVFKKSIATLLVIMIIISAVITGFAATVESSIVGGPIVNVVTGGWSALAAGAIERTIVFAISETAAAQSNPQMTEALNWAGRILGGYEGAALGEITVMCEEILEDLAVISDTLNDSTRNLDASINKVQLTLDKENYEKHYEPLRKLNSSYSMVLDEYKLLVKALEAYSKEPTESHMSDLKFQYDKVDHMFDNNQTAVQINFPNDLEVLLHGISPYEYTYDYSALTKDTNDSYADYPYADRKYWGSAGNTDTYIDAVYDLSTDVYSFENVTYENLKGAINYVSNLAFTYLSVYSMYTEFEVQKINSDPSYSSEAVRNNTISSKWDAYNKTANQVCRAIEQMVSLYENELNTFMRDYDTEICVQMEHADSHTYEINFAHDAKTYATDKVGESMNVYQFKPVNSNVSFIIRKSDYDNEQAYDTTPGSVVNNTRLNAGDMVEVTDNDYTWGVIDLSYVSSDFRNLQKSVSPSGYSMLKSVNDLYPIIDTTAFKDEDGHFMPFLKTQLQYSLYPRVTASSNVSNISDINVNIPDVVSKQSDQNTMADGQFMMLETAIDWNPDGVFTPNHDADTTWLNISQPISSSEGSDNEIKIDVEDDIAERESVRSAESVVMLSGQPSVKFKVENSSGGDCDVRIGNSENLNGKESEQKSGSVVTIKVKPNEGKTISNISLTNENGDVLEHLFSSEELASEEYFENLNVDENGYYTFKCPVPYQNAKLKVDYKDFDKAYEKYTAKLENVYKDGEATPQYGKISFATSTSFDEMSFKSGDVVSINVRPYDNYVCQNIKVTTESGRNVEVSDISDATISVTPTSKEYMFIMPDENVKVSAEFENGYVVTLNNKDRNGKIEFSDTMVDCIDYDMTKPMTIQENDIVNIVVKPDSGYYLSKIYIVDDVQNEQKYNYKDGVVSFRMPNKPLTVFPEFLPKKANKHTVQLNSNELCKAEFIEGGAVKTGIVEKYFDTNETVTVKTNANEQVEVSLFSVKKYDENNNLVDLDYTDNGDGTYSFVMPSSNVIVNSVGFDEFDEDENGRLIIKTYDDLCAMSNFINSDIEEYKTKSYVLANNIDCSGKTGFVPIGQTELYYNANPSADGNRGFKSTFDGQGHVIKNLSITGSSDKDLSYGIFGTVSGTVKNLGIENLTYTGAGKDSRVGGIAGQVLQGGTITDCYVINSNINTQVNTANGVVGGIAGANYGGTIENCYTYDVDATAGRSGGIVGDNYGDANNADGTDRAGNIKNCYTSSEAICGRGTATDGLSNVSINTFMSGEITYRLNNGVIDGTQRWYQKLGNGYLSDLFPVYSGPTVYYGYLYCTSTDKTYTNQEITDGYIHKYDENGFCELCGKYEPAPLNEDGFYEISNAGQLYWFASLVNGDKTNADFSKQNTDANAILMNDIIVNSQEITSATDPKDIRVWNPMGYSRFSGYTGTFDGQGHYISGLYHNSNDSYVGFFGFVDNGAVIKNLGIVNSYFHGGNYTVGSICSDLYGSTIENCYSTAEVKGNICGTSEIGGLVGVVSAGSGIRNSYFAGKVDENSDYVGSICGSLWANSVIENSYYNGSKDYFKIHSTAKSNAEKKTAEQFASGEVTYLLNNGVTDGTQAWYQNIVGENADAYPVLDNTHSTVYKTDGTYINGDLIGDMNRDGVVDEADLTLLTEYLVRKAVLTADEVTLGDVNGDGKTDPNDLILMKAYVNKEGTDYANTGKYGLNTMPTDALLVGDVNFDGVIDQSDADLISQFNVEMTDLTDEQKKAGDIDLDGHLSSKDMAEINKYIAVISSGKTYTGNIGKYSYQGFEMNIQGGHTSTAPTVPKPDDTNADSSTSDSVNKNNGTINTGKTDNGTVKTGDPVNCVILLSVLLSGLVLVLTLRRYKNK